jgi:hypothetical protein
MKTKSLLCALAVLAWAVVGLAVDASAAAQTQPAGKLTVTYFYLPG